MMTILIKLCIKNDRKDLILIAAIVGLGFDVTTMVMMARLMGIGK